MLLGRIAAAIGPGGAPLQYLDVSSHHGGDAMLEGAPPLLSGPHAPRSLLLHDNQLTTAGLETLAMILTKAGEGATGGEGGSAGRRDSGRCTSRARAHA